MLAPAPQELAIILLVYSAMVAVVALVFVWPVCRIVGKAGFHPLLGLLVMIPFLNILLVWLLAFADWPALRQSLPGEK